MLNKQYLVTMIHKKGVTQHLVKGSMNDAIDVMAGLERRYKGIRSNRGSVAEITNSEITLYIADEKGKKLDEYKMPRPSIDKDIYLVQEYINQKNSYCVSYGVTDSKEEFDEELRQLARNRDSGKQKSVHIANRINYRSVSRIIPDTQTGKIANEVKVTPISCQYIEETGEFELDSEPDVTPAK